MSMRFMNQNGVTVRHGHCATNLTDILSTTVNNQILTRNLALTGFICFHETTGPEISASRIVQTCVLCETFIWSLRDAEKCLRCNQYMHGTCAIRSYSMRKYITSSTVLINMPQGKPNTVNVQIPPTPQQPSTPQKLPKPQQKPAPRQPPNAKINKNNSSPNPQLKDSHKTIQTVVNSMTSNNLVSSSEQLISHISSIAVDRIEEILDVLFKTAIFEPERIPLLVDTCSSLKGIVLKADAKGSECVSFKAQLALRCQPILQMRSFERNSKYQNTLKNAYTMIGELFNKHLVPLNVMVEFIKDLHNQSSDEFIEILCHLLKIIGVEIERPYNLKSTMKRLEKIVENNVEASISPLCKDAIKNLTKLRNNKWNLMNSDVEKPSKKKQKAKK